MGCCKSAEQRVTGAASEDAVLAPAPALAEGAGPRSSDRDEDAPGRPAAAAGWD
jgi:hypothetical protein